MGWMPFERKGDYDDLDYGRARRVRRACAALCVLLVILLILLGLATLITYLVLRPRAARSSITSASVPTLTATSMTATSTITSQILYGVELRNPNTRVTLEYDALHLQTTYVGVDIGHRGFALGRVRVPPRGAVVVSAATSAASVEVSNIVADALRRDIARGSVAVRTKIDVRVRAHVGSYTSFWVWVHSVCDVVVSTPNGAVAGTLQRADCHNT